jgi:hypothetical protein
MMRVAIAVILVVTGLPRASAHDFGSAPTWNREISRIVYDKCASCHRPGGTSFSLMTYRDAQARGNDIKDAVLSRRMPPWGAVKGFGSFRNDQSLTEEQIELVRRWVDAGIRRGNNPNVLPKVPVFPEAPTFRRPIGGISVSGPVTLQRSMAVDGIFPERVDVKDSFRVVAQRPDGRLEPLVWLHSYDPTNPHAFLFRRPIQLPPGTTIHGVPRDVSVTLIPAIP